MTRVCSEELIAAHETRIEKTEHKNDRNDRSINNLSSRVSSLEAELSAASETNNRRFREASAERLAIAEKVEKVDDKMDKINIDLSEEIKKLSVQTAKMVALVTFLVTAFMNYFMK